MPQADETVKPELPMTIGQVTDAIVCVDSLPPEADVRFINHHGDEDAVYRPRIERHRLAADDVTLFRQLLVMFGKAFEDADNYTKQRPGNGYIEELLGSDHFVALAAVQENAVIGGLAAYELKKFEQERSEIYIYDLAVAAEHRRKGVATGLIEMLRTIAGARGAYVIFVQAGPADRPAVALYTKLGVRQDVLHFDIPIA